MFWRDLHQKICTTLKEEIPAIQTCEVYRVIRREIIAPAVFVELASLEPGKDPGTEELALRARFEARVVVDGTVENSSIVVRSLAAEVARVVSKNTWNMKNIAPGEFLSAEVDDFKPELDAYLVWLVEWTHEVHTGQSMWSETGIKPHIIEIGLVKEVDYEKARVRVKVGEFLTNWLPWITTRAGEDRSWFAPNVDEQIVIFSPLGELSLGVVLAGIYQQKYPAPESKKEVSSVVFKDGTKLSYNKENGHLEIDVVDKITLKVGESSIKMTKKGIKLKAKRIDLN
ncbi:spike protein [Trichonephila clavata]|uniref:Spike protein n=1 Tax=Trichonephila clavata TaxID=2740835 RepID=A0A8X6L106_TRICU|nr:spike protein [Trichonephila clavata]